MTVRLVACALVVSAVGAVLVGDTRPVPSGSGSIGRQQPSAVAAAPQAPAAHPSTVGQGGGRAAQRSTPARLVIVRPGTVDSFSAGVLVRRTARDNHVVSLATLAAAIPPSWMTIAGDTARLDTAVLLTLGTRLNVDGVRTLQMAGGDDPRIMTFLATGHGQIQLRGVTVTSIDPASAQPVAPDAAGRPYIKVSDGGSLTATDSAITDLGTNPFGVVTGEPAISFDRGSTGTLTRTTLQRSSTGLVLAASQGVHLQDVTVSESSSNGIVLRGDRSTVLSNVKAERNGDNGVLVGGEIASRPITGITTTGNRSYGVSVNGQSNLEVHNLTLAGDQTGGLELSHVGDSHVHNITTIDEPIGVCLHDGSTNPVLDAMSVSGGRTGILADKTTTGMRFTDSTIQSAHVVGMAYDGRDGTLAGLTIKDSLTALRVERGTGALTIDKLSIIGGGDGLVTSSRTPGIVVKDLSADGVSNDAIRNLGPGMRIIGGQIRGSRTGMDLQAPTAVTGMRVGPTSTGVRTSTAGPIVLDGVSIDAAAVGVAAPPGIAVTLHNSSVHADRAILGAVNLSGVNDLSQPPINLLGAIGLPLILLALVLEFLHLLNQIRRARSRRRDDLRRWRALASNPTSTKATTATTCSTCGTTPPAPRSAPTPTSPETCDACALR